MRKLLCSKCSMLVVEQEQKFNEKKNGTDYSLVL